MRHLSLTLCLLFTLTACGLWGEQPTPTPAVVTATPAALTATPTSSATSEAPPATLPPTPRPTATHNARLPEWTILVYMSGDNNLEAAGLFNLNEMEAAGLTNQTQVVVQFDGRAGEWADVRRYQISRDQDTQQISSELLESLGEKNMGDPAVLADFVQWGRENYPANHTALVLWGHGLGWQGLAFDENPRDQLTLSELGRALAQSTAEGAKPLDLIGWDACLMGQVEVYSTVTPYAHYAVGSEELTPGRGWPYRTWLSWLAENPQASTPEVTQQLVSQFVQGYDQTGQSFVTMSAVDLGQMAVVQEQITQLSEALLADVRLTAGRANMARSAADYLALAYGGPAQSYGVIDLTRFVTLLQDPSQPAEVQAAATQLSQSLQASIISHQTGLGLKAAEGMTIYFPASPAAYNPAYANETPLSAWQEWLTAYFTAAPADLTPPQVAIVNSFPEEPANWQQPAHVAFQVTGREIEQVAVVAGQVEADGRKLLLEYDPLIPEPTYLANGEKVYQWRDGLHEDFYIWQTRVTYLSDGTNGQFVVLWPSYSDNYRTVQGVYTSVSGNQTFEATLTFEQNRLVAGWGTDQGGAPFELVIRPGDTFQPHVFYLLEDGSLSTAGGVSLVFDAAGQLQVAWFALPTNSYFLGFEAQNRAGQKNLAVTTINVDNGTLVANGADAEALAYLDPYLGFQFLYPAAWYRPVYANSALYTTNLSGTMGLQLTIYPNVAGKSPQNLKTETLARFGNVQLLYEDSVIISQWGGLLTAYTYTNTAGVSHTGLFFTMVREGVGYVVDVDGLTQDEGQLVEVMGQITRSWVFRPVGSGLFPNQWARVEVAELQVLKPADFQQQESGEWQRLTAIEDSRIFVALRTDPISQAAEKAVLAWSKVAGQGVAQFTPGRLGQYVLGGRVWWRQEFTYYNGRGEEIWGYVMVAEENGQQLTAWSEAPAGVYNQLENEVFAVLLAETEWR